MVSEFAYDPVDNRDKEMNWYTIGSDLGAIMRLALGFKSDDTHETKLERLFPTLNSI